MATPNIRQKDKNKNLSMFQRDYYICKKNRCIPESLHYGDIHRHDLPSSLGIYVVPRHQTKEFPSLYFKDLKTCRAHCPPSARRSIRHDVKGQEAIPQMSLLSEFLDEKTRALLKSTSKLAYKDVPPSAMSYLQQCLHALNGRTEHKCLHDCSWMKELINRLVALEGGTNIRIECVTQDKKTSFSLFIHRGKSLMSMMMSGIQYLLGISNQLH